MIGEPALKSHIDSLHTTTSTRARIILNETVYTQLVVHMQKLLHENRITNIRTKMLSPEAFRNYNKQKVHIDVLSSGDILLEGNKLQPENLNISLSKMEINRDTEFIISVSENAEVGPVFDTQEMLADNNLQMQVSNEDLSKY